MKFSSILMLILLLLLSSANGKYSNSPYRIYKFNSLNINNGLSQNASTAIIQDSDGFIWIGTENGLNRYDGYNFEIFKKTDDSTGISHNSINCIFEDSYGYLWIGTNDGLNKYDRETRKFKQYFTGYKNPELQGKNRIWSITEDESGNLWIGSSPYMILFERKKNKFYFYNIFKNITSKFHSFVQDDVGRMWAGYADSLACFKLDSLNKIRIHKKLRVPANQSNCLIQTMFIAKKGEIWIGTDKGLISLKPETNEFQIYNPEQNRDGKPELKTVRCIIQDKHENIIIGYIYGGMGIVEKKSKIIKKYPGHVFQKDILEKKPIISLYIDRSGLIWIGTLGSGIYTYNPKQKFMHFKKGNILTGEDDEYFVNTILKDNKKNIWIGTLAGGLDKYNSRLQSMQNYSHNPLNSNSISSNFITCLEKDKNNLIWIGTDNGVNRFDPGKNTFIKYQQGIAIKKGLTNNVILTIKEHPNGTIWIGTIKGLNLLDPSSGKIIKFLHNPENQTSISSDFVNVLHHDSHNNTWIGTYNGGLNKFNKKAEAFEHYLPEKHNPYSINDKDISCIFEESSDKFWIGTGTGLSLFNPQTGHFVNYSKNKEFISSAVYGIVADSSNTLWISSSNGLYRFDKEKENFRKFNLCDGLQSNEYNMNAYFKDENGAIYLGGYNGLNIIDSESEKINNDVPTISITSINVLSSSNNKVKKTYPKDLEVLKLAYNQNTLRLEFAVMDFIETTSNKFSYILEGAMDKWIFLGNQNNITLSGLSPGQYVLKVKGCNSNEIWNDTKKGLSIVITPPPWKTWWAYLIYSILFIIIIISLRFYDLKRLYLKNKLHIKEIEANKLKEVDQAKSKFFENISHEFRTPLTLIIDPLEQLESGNFKGDIIKNYSIMKQNAIRLLNLINQVLDLSKLNTGKLKLQTYPENIVNFIKTKTQLFSSFAEKKKIDLQFISSTENIETYFDPDKVEKIIFNLLSNAIKFTPEMGKVKTEISVLDGKAVNPNPHHIKQFVQIKINDTGKGIDRKQFDKIFNRFYQIDSNSNFNSNGIGLGLALTKELVELHKGIIQLESFPGKGTTFSLLLPLGNKHLKNEEIYATKIFHKSTLEIDVDSKEENIHTIENSSDTENTIPQILIIEDNEDVRQYIADSLKNNYKIHLATNGKEGLEKSINIIPDLVISDIMMPVLDGIEFCSVLRNNEKISHIPVILLTANTSDVTKFKSLETGADDFLTKPFKSKELILRVRNLIKQREKLHEKYSRELFLMPGEISVTSIDEKFLNKAMKIIEENLTNSNFNVEIFSKEIGMSRVQLYRKINALTGASVSKFIINIRLKRAIQLLKQNYGNISEIAYEVGFNNPIYFSKCFKEQFGISPSKYNEKIENTNKS